jgi:hypothetical protein
VGGAKSDVDLMAKSTEEHSMVHSGQKVFQMLGVTIISLPASVEHGLSKSQSVILIGVLVPGSTTERAAQRKGFPQPHL